MLLFPNGINIGLINRSSIVYVQLVGTLEYILITVRIVMNRY